MTTAFGTTITRNDVINAALRSIGKLGQTQVASPEDFANCSQALNFMIKAWMNKGPTLWKIEMIPLPLIPGIVQYPIGPSAGYLATVGVTITAPGVGGVDGTYGLGISDPGGGGSGAVGTFDIVDGLLTSVTITTPGSAYVTPILDFSASGIIDAAVAVTTVGITRSLPTKFLDQGSFVRNNDQQTDITVMMISRIEYNMLGNKSNDGTQPCQYFADLQIPNRQIYVYPPPGNDGVSRSLHLVAQIMLNDTVNAAELFDFPQEFMNALKWGLAHEIMTEYGVDERTERRVIRMYEMYYAAAFDFSVEEASTFLTYDARGSGSGWGGGWGGGGW